MLQELLNEIQSGGALETRLLAARLGTTPEMVSVMLEHLERIGVLQDLRQCVPEGCHGCDLAESCSLEKSTSRMWRLAGER